VVRESAMCDPDFWPSTCAGCRCRAFGASPPASARSSSASSCLPSRCPLSYVALIARMTRASMLDVLGKIMSELRGARASARAACWLRHACACAVPVIHRERTGFASADLRPSSSRSRVQPSGVAVLPVDALLARDYPVIRRDPCGPQASMSWSIFWSTSLTPCSDPRNSLLRSR